MSQRDEYCTQHGEYQCLNVAYQYFEEHHKGAHRNTYYCHTRTCHIVGDSILTDVEHDENDSRKRKCDGVTRHHVGEESDNQSQRFRKDSEELDEWHQWHWHLQPRWYLWPEDFLPVFLGTGEVGNQECRYTEEYGAGDITRQVTTTWREWYDTHDVRHEDKEEASKQPWCVLWGFLTQGGLNHIGIYRHDEHVHQSHKSLWCRVIHLVLPAPAGWYQDTEQQDDSIDEEHANGLRDGDVKRTNLLASHLLYYLVGIRLRISVLDHQVERSWTVSIGILLFREFAAAEHVPACGGVHDDRQMNHYGMVSHLCDMPFIRILDMTPQYLFHVDVFLGRYLQRCQREEQHRHQEELLEMFHIL